MLVKHLELCYQCLDAYDSKRIASSSKKVADLYIALEKEALLNSPDDTRTWRVKPKLHMFQHLCEFPDHSPKDFWCYKDESAMGECARLFTRRGGWDNPGVSAEKFLLRWCGLQNIPAIPR